jgi:hypothetical protein
MFDGANSAYEIQANGVLSVGGAGGVHHSCERVETAAATPTPLSCSSNDDINNGFHSCKRVETVAAPPAPLSCSSKTFIIVSIDVRG